MKAVRLAALRDVTVRCVLLAGVAAGLALVGRNLVAHAIEDRLGDAGGALAQLGQRLPTPGRALEVPLAIAPIETVTITTTAPLSTANPIASPKKRLAVKPSAKDLTPLRVTRAEVEAAIAAKVYGARTKLARDEQGKTVGLALYGTGALARLGIHDGDVLVSANGHSLRTPEDALGAVAALKDATRITVVLRRGDGSYALTVDVGE